MLTDSSNKPLPEMEVVVEPPVAGSAPDDNGTVVPVTDARPADTANKNLGKPKSLADVDRDVSGFYVGVIIL